jgi:1-acyl-sn-glycerol-3-phosphate acyltransferase
MRAIEAAAASLRAGHSFLVFPEGTRSPTDEMLPFKKGVFVMAIKAQAPVVPIAIKGGRDAMRRGSRVIQPVTISIRVGEPVETAGLDVKNRDAVIATVRGRIAQLLSETPV